MDIRACDLAEYQGSAFDPDRTNADLRQVENRELALRDERLKARFAAVHVRIADRRPGPGSVVSVLPKTNP
nr:hypothetical protein [Bradyrhizobium sp. CCBAU 51745]